MEAITVTSSQANKFLRTLQEEYNFIARKESQSSVFNAATSENPDDVRPNYTYSETKAILDEINRKTRCVKHALNLFNTTTVIPEFGITIDEALVLIPQLSREKSKLAAMKARLPKERVENFKITGVIDYRLINYDLAEVENDYNVVSAKLNALQNALDVVNGTVTFELQF